MPIASIPAYNLIQVRVPKIETRRFKTIARALGCTIEKQCAVERSLAEAEAGMVYEYDSLEDLIKEIG